MKITILLIFTLFNFSNTYAQSKCKIVKALAFFTIIQPGTIPIDENGNPMKLPLNIVRTIYLTTTCTDKPIIKEIKYGNVLTKHIIGRVGINNIFLGKDVDGNKINLQKTSGNYLWKIELLSSDIGLLENLQIFIKSSIQKKSFVTILKKETEITGALSN